MEYFNKIANLTNRFKFGNTIREFSVLVPFLRINETEKILFEIRSKNVPQPGEICFPGGNRKSCDFSPKDTAVRETCEELGIESSQIENLFMLGTLNSSMDKTIHIFTAQINVASMSEMNIEKNEVEQIFSIPADYFAKNIPDVYSVSTLVSPMVKGKLSFPAAQLKLPEVYHDDWGHVEKKVYVYNTEYGLIWGITAQIIYDIFSNFQKS